MRLLAIYIVTSIALLSYGAEAFGQELSVTLGRMTVHIGMSDERVLAESRAKGQRITTLRGFPDSALVWDREDANDTARTLGTLVFEAGKLKAVYKRWSVEPTERDTDVGAALFGVAAEFVAAGLTACTISTRLHVEPGQQEQIVSIKCGRRAIEISTARFDDQRLTSTTVTEWVQ